MQIHLRFASKAGMAFLAAARTWHGKIPKSERALGQSVTSRGKWKGPDHFEAWFQFARDDPVKVQQLILFEYDAFENVRLFRYREAIG
jgi:hypothetical protein